MPSSPRRHPPPPAGDGDEPALEQVVDRGREEERVPLGAAVDLGHERGVDRVAREPLREIRADVIAGEELERQLHASTTGDQTLLHRLQRMSPDHQIHRSVRADDQQARGSGALGDVGERVDCRTVAPVQVLEDEHERAIPRQRLERLAELPQHPVAVRARHATMKRLRPLPVEERRHLKEPGRRPALQDGEYVAAVGVSAEAAEDVEHRQICLPAAGKLRALAERHPGAAVVADLFHEALHERGLPDPGLAGHERDLPAPGLHAHQMRVEAREVAVSTNQRALRGGWCVGIDGEAIAPPPDGGDERRADGVVVERRADLADADPQHGVAHRRLRPAEPEELLLGDQSTAVLGEVTQDRE